ncbi:uncharacterized protein LOC123510034 isoform X2 [Portunus trituberculatus]|uniref:uncharacterized protein LOC123510034 isoform X2 n=1 Tax=Portunus trituberculatus TaxID=210409 RepID=UPI001E1D1FE5|nr:uncharacterized protein LOC123510034 isoform X2 [Portunus trituberculatus]
MRSIMEDTSPRLTPPPKPAVLEVSTPKHAVPEVSLVCDSHSNFTGQALQQNPGTSNTSNRLKSNTKMAIIAPGCQEVTQGIARWPQTYPMQDFLCNIPRGAPSQPVVKDKGHSSPVTTPRPMLSHREEREIKGFQNTASSSHSIYFAKEYNPQLYSPVTHCTTRSTAEAEDGPLQKDNSVGKRLISSKQRFYPVSTISHPLRMQEEPLPVVSSTRITRHDPVSAYTNIVPSVIEDVQQVKPTGVTISPHILPHSSDMQDSAVGDSINNRQNTFPSSSRITTAQINTFTSSYPPVSLNIIPRSTTTLPLTPPADTHKNAIHTSESFPHFQQTRPSSRYQGISGKENWSSPASSPFSAPSISPYITHGPKYQQSQSLGHSSNHDSPVLPEVGLSHSPADPVVYRLIENQKQQILKLTLDLQKIIEKQAKQEEEEEGRKTLKIVNSQRRMMQKQDVLHQDATTQTEDTQQLAVQTVAVNTDISWQELIGSTKHQEEEIATYLKHSRIQGQEGWVRDISDGQKSFPLHCHCKQPSNNGESVLEVIKKHSQEDNELPNSQKWDQVRPAAVSPIATINTSFTSANAGFGRRCLEAVDGGDPGISSVPSSTPPHTGTTFYHNVLTNIQQILQHTSPAQEKQEQQHEHHHDQQHDQYQHHHPVTIPLQGTAAKGSLGEATTPDPQIEAVRQQLLSFGVSFLDPTTLTPNSRPLVDSLYLPGLHNAVSLFQSSISTHIHHANDATAAKYLTDSQLAAIAAASPAMKKASTGSKDQPVLDQLLSVPPIHQQHNHLYNPGEEDENHNCVSITTQKFLKKYHLQED